MDLLKDWLAPTIEHELSQALQWKQGGPDVTQLVGGKAGYSDDGSNLRIQSSREGVVQISKVQLMPFPMHVQKLTLGPVLDLSSTNSSDRFGQNHTNWRSNILICHSRLSRKVSMAYYKRHRGWLNTNPRIRDRCHAFGSSIRQTDATRETFQKLRIQWLRGSERASSNREP